MLRFHPQTQDSPGLNKPNWLTMPRDYPRVAAALGDIERPRAVPTIASAPMLRSVRLLNVSLAEPLDHWQ